MVFLTDKEKQILLDRYSDIVWCDDVTDLRCVLCNRVAITNHQSMCPHIICNNCKEIYVDEDPELDCPLCQFWISPTGGTNYDAEEKIHQLRICCPNKKYGCNYADELRKMPSHLMTCMDSREKALPVETPVVNSIIDVANQLGNLNATIGELSKRMKVVDKVAEKLIHVERKIDDIGFALASEEQNVKERKPGMKLASAEYTKEFQSMTLKLQSMNQRIQQNELFVQQKMEQLTLKIEEISTKVNSMAEKKEARQKKRSEELIPLKAETYDWTVKDVKNFIKNRTYESEVFNIRGCKYDIKAKLEIPIITLQFKNGDKINEFLPIDYGFTDVSYIIRDQSDTQKKNDIYFRKHLRFDADCHDWILNFCLPDEVQFPPYMKDDCIKITMLFEPQLIDCSFHSNNGTLLWRVDNYEARKQHPWHYDFWSPCFYTSPRGYRVGIILSLTERPISVSVCFITGKHDAMLSYDFHHMTTVTLINQSDPSMNITKSRQRRDVDSYSISLTKRKLTEENGFIKGDSLLLKVVIEPLATN